MPRPRKSAHEKIMELREQFGIPEDDTPEETVESRAAKAGIYAPGTSKIIS